MTVYPFGHISGHGAELTRADVVADNVVFAQGHVGDRRW
jgi:hypothetical protein